jgi:hypothetical protein
MIETAWRHGKSESKITRLLPPEGEDFQYKIKSAAEPHERVGQGKSTRSRRMIKGYQ